MAKYRLRLQNYLEQKKTWPTEGRHILAQHGDDDTLVVYQAFKPSIAEWAIKNQKFGGPDYSWTRMTWIKTNFLWMMYRSSWGQSSGQEMVLAIHITKLGLETILSRSPLGSGGGKDAQVRLQWDPDHDPNGDKEVRRAVQLGLRGETLMQFNSDWIVNIEDCSEIVKEGRKCVAENRLDLLRTPAEKVLKIENINIINNIGLDIYPGHRKNVILSLGGSFNPIHKDHISLLEKAKSWLEDMEGFRVVAGLVVVSTDSYVKQKMGGECRVITAEHRIKMCRLATSSHSWIQVHPIPCVSGWEAGMVLRTGYDGVKPMVCMVKGGDKYSSSRRGHWRHPYKGQALGVRMDVIVGRGEGIKQMVRDYQEDLDSGLVVNKDYFVVGEAVGKLSSTDVRQLLDNAEGVDTVRDELENMINREVVNYLSENLLNLNVEN